MYPKSFIYFGVLHGLALMLVICRFTAGWRLWLWPLGAMAFAMPLIAAYAHKIWADIDFLNEKAFNWLGLISRKPIAEDYVPLLPWLGVMWWGMAFGQGLLGHLPRWLGQPLPAQFTPVIWLGRWSLSWYMLHQPVMIGVLMGLAAIR